MTFVQKIQLLNGIMTPYCRTRSWPVTRAICVICRKTDILRLPTACRFSTERVSGRLVSFTTTEWSGSLYADRPGWNRDRPSWNWSVSLELKPVRGPDPPYQAGRLAGPGGLETTADAIFSHRGEGLAALAPDRIRRR